MSATASAPAANSANQSHLNSKWYDVLPHIQDAAKKSILGIFTRTLSLPVDCLMMVNPWRWLDSYDRAQELTPDRIQFLDDPMHYQNQSGVTVVIPPKERVTQVINRIRELAKQQGITKEIRFFASDNLGAVGTCFSRHVVFLLNRATVLESDEAIIDFLVSHELAHVTHNHVLKELALKIGILVLEGVCAFFISPWLIPVMIPVSEGIAAPIELFARRVREKEADFTAMKSLNSNRGAVAYWASRIAYWKNFRDSQECPSDVPPSMFSEREKFLSPEGNNRWDLPHPRRTTRLAYSQAFHKKDQ